MIVGGGDTPHVEHRHDGLTVPSRQTMRPLLAQEEEISGDDSVVVFGMIQSKRGAGQQLLAIEASNTVAGSTETLWMASLDTKMWLPSVRPFLVHTSENFSRWQERLPGLAHAVAFKGKFHLTSLVVTVDILSGTIR